MLLYLLRDGCLRFLLWNWIKGEGKQERERIRRFVSGGYLGWMRWQIEEHWLQWSLSSFMQALAIDWTAYIMFRYVLRFANKVIGTTRSYRCTHKTYLIPKLKHISFTSNIDAHYTCIMLLFCCCFSVIGAYYSYATCASRCVNRNQ